jgi:hypothetical protein
MQPTTHTIPKIAIQSIGGGLLLMVFFTMMWAGIASGGLTGVGQYAVIFLFGVPCGIFVAYSISFFKLAKQFPPLASEADKAEGKKMGIWYGIIFGAEGIIIPIVCGALIYFRQTSLVLPAIALVVGLHFYPMAKVFGRTIDYYLATWTSIVAIAAIILTLNNTLPRPAILTLLGIGVAIATTGYGLYMIYEGKRMAAINN